MFKEARRKRIGKPKETNKCGRENKCMANTFKEYFKETPQRQAQCTVFLAGGCNW